VTSHDAFIEIEPHRNGWHRHDPEPPDVPADPHRSRATDCLTAIH
jgi:hypothetical protein